MIPKGSFATVYAALIVTTLFLHLHQPLAVPVAIPFDRFPARVGQWRMTAESRLPAGVRGVLRASDLLLREYRSGQGEPVELYITTTAARRAATSTPPGTACRATAGSGNRA